MMEVCMSNQKGLFKTEDWWSVWLGILVFIVSLGPLVGLDLLGWAVDLRMWTDIKGSIVPFSKNYESLSPILSIIFTYLAMLAVLSVGAKALGYDLKKFFYGFTVIFWISYICNIIGNYAVIAANTPAQLEKFNIAWSLKLTGESGL